MSIVDVPDDTRRAFAMFLTKVGSPRPERVRAAPVDPREFDDNDETDCWTYAFEYAARTGAAYFEGACIGPRGRMVIGHAWCEEETPFGTVIVEVTPEYVGSHDYFGVRVTDPGPWALGDQRYSVIESAIYAGVDPRKVIGGAS